MSQYNLTPLQETDQKGDVETCATLCLEAAWQFEHLRNMVCTAFCCPLMSRNPSLRESTSEIENESHTKPRNFTTHPRNDHKTQESTRFYVKSLGATMTPCYVSQPLNFKLLQDSRHEMAIWQSEGKNKQLNAIRRVWSDTNQSNNIKGVKSRC